MTVFAFHDLYNLTLQKFSNKCFTKKQILKIIPDIFFVIYCAW